MARSAPSRLAAFSLFDDLSVKELKAIERLLAPVDFRAGKEFIKEGSPGGEAFVILDGPIGGMNAVWFDLWLNDR